MYPGVRILARRHLRRSLWIEQSYCDEDIFKRASLTKEEIVCMRYCINISMKQKKLLKQWHSATKPLKNAHSRKAWNTDIFWTVFFPLHCLLTLAHQFSLMQILLFLFRITPLNVVLSYWRVPLPLPIQYNLRKFTIFYIQKNPKEEGYEVIVW